ncbi:uncharacterized protein CLUP02_03663 [Colletotrichum lupini]|uniref:Uncharacterized protein n=1 Tax=Colletotrichum lupini TaxID=145971 RepID=A0A9Q8WCY8_9PEZI|nr:uncharacterized protein CLUP02_03663 [Colletotrichum lupini]UQC78187.1 hypothetical protein CLUP02_03663 [Colletotrichum lupini]
MLPDGRVWVKPSVTGNGNSMTMMEGLYVQDAKIRSTCSAMCCAVTGSIRQVEMRRLLQGNQNDTVLNGVRMNGVVLRFMFDFEDPRGRLRLHRSGGLYWMSIHLCQCRAGLGSVAVPSDPALVPEGRKGGAGLVAEGARSILQQEKTLEGGTENGTRSSAHTLPTVPLLGIRVYLGNFQVAINNLLRCISQPSNRDAPLWHFLPVTSSVLCNIFNPNFIAYRLPPPGPTSVNTSASAKIRTTRRMSPRCLADSAPANDPPGSTHGTLVDVRGMVPYHAVGTIPTEARCLNGLVAYTDVRWKSPVVLGATQQILAKSSPAQRRSAEPWPLKVQPHLRHSPYGQLVYLMHGRQPPVQGRSEVTGQAANAAAKSQKHLHDECHASSLHELCKKDLRDDCLAAKSLNSVAHQRFITSYIRRRVGDGIDSLLFILICASFTTHIIIITILYQSPSSLHRPAAPFWLSLDAYRAHGRIDPHAVPSKPFWAWAWSCLFCWNGTLGSRLLQKIRNKESPLRIASWLRDSTRLELVDHLDLAFASSYSSTLTARLPGAKKVLEGN